MNHEKSNRKELRFSLATTLREVKIRLYGKDGHAFKE